jgi:glutamate dehydrogenase (NAD(P)+)
VLIPAAIADVINDSNCDRVTAGLIVEAANIPTTASAGLRLHQRGVTVVPDFVANAGTNVWYWWVVLKQVEPTAEAAFDRIAKAMRQTVSSVLSTAAEQGVSPREAAEAAAYERLDRMARQA